MKYIGKKYQQLIEDTEKKYQQLIEDIEKTYDNMCDTLRDQIEDLKKTIQDKNEEIKELKGGDKLRKDGNEYNRLKAQKNMNLEGEITQLKAENARIKKAYSDLEKAYKITVDAPAPAKKTGRKAGSKSKTIVARCKDCGTYFQAKSKLAKYCSKCKTKRIKESQAKWLAKQK